MRFSNSQFIGRDRGYEDGARSRERRYLVRQTIERPVSDILLLPIMTVSQRSSILYCLGKLSAGPEDLFASARAVVPSLVFPFPSFLFFFFRAEMQKPVKLEGREEFTSRYAPFLMTRKSIREGRNDRRNDNPV